MSGTMNRRGQPALHSSVSDITLSRDPTDFINKQDRLPDRTDATERIHQQQEIIRALQNHVALLEKQISRVIKLNPVAQDLLNKDKAENADPNDMQNQIAQLLQNSTLLRSYESVIQGFEEQLGKKTKLCEQLERDFKQAVAENNTLSDQIYKLRTEKWNQGGDQANNSDADSQMVDLLRKNHDLMHEKYELYRARNETLETAMRQKEELWIKTKSENEQLQDHMYGLKRINEDLKQDLAVSKAKLVNSEQLAKSNGEQAVSFKLARDKHEQQVKLLSEQVEILSKSQHETVQSKDRELQLLQKDLTQTQMRERDLKQRAATIEKEWHECKDQLRQALSELDTRTKENDHLLSLLEDQEQKIAIYEEKEKHVSQLALESKKRIEDANLERDRVLLKEQQLLTRISTLERQIQTESQDLHERHDRVLTQLRQKHKHQMEQKADEHANLKRLLTDAQDSETKMRLEFESRTAELFKLHEQLRSFKDDTSSKYEAYNKQIAQQEQMSESRVSQLKREVERLRDTEEDLQQQSQKAQIKLHENEVKVDLLARENDRLLTENKRDKELVMQLREEKDSLVSELTKTRAFNSNRVHDLQDEANSRCAHLEEQMLEMKQRHKQYEERAYNILIAQEKLTEKWKDEHRKTAQYFERVCKDLEVENRHLQDQVVELRGKYRAVKDSKQK